jgi:carbon starvation protein CstA
MLTFCAALVLLLLGYLFYGKFLAAHIGVAPERPTPAVARPDGVDYVPLKPWRVFMIQFLNIAGLGPIFGAIMGAKFGTASFLWIVFGCVFGGAVHDFVAAMISLRRDGVSLPEIHGEALGGGVKALMRGFTVLVMVLAGTVFVANPADMLATKMPEAVTPWLTREFWLVAIFAYYVAATLLPIDKIIGRLYPFFAFCLLFMGAAILVLLLVNQPPLPELWDGLQNRHPKGDAMPVFPMMFISIACGAVSGFHATQSPMMARCLTNEKYARPIFYGAMIAEGALALVWAAAASALYFSPDAPATALAASPAAVVDKITAGQLGVFGTALAFLGVIAAPITSGDTAFRSARLTIADFLHLDQRRLGNRLLITLPLFAAALLLLLYMLRDKAGFEIIWRYFGWANQVLATVTLWAISVFLVRLKKHYWLTLLPALFMTAVTTSYLFVAPEGFALPQAPAYALSAALTIAAGAAFVVLVVKRHRERRRATRT